MHEAGRQDSGAHREGVWPLVTNREMQALDRRTIDERGVPGEMLMENAGRALIRPALALRARSPRPQAPIRAFCGAGNNGGDGFVLVRHLLGEGVPAEAVLLGDPEALPPDAAAHWRRLERIDAPRRTIEMLARSRTDAVTPPSTSTTTATTAAAFDWAALFDDTAVAVDALFGTGLARAIEGPYAAFVEALCSARRRGLPVLAVDIPSGIEANTGTVLGVAVEADRTVTISLPKVGLALEPGRGHAGAVQVARVGIADPDPERLPRVELWNARAAARHFPERPASGHKGRFGHVLVVAGSAGKMGAASLSSRAAARAGAGLVTLAHPWGLEAQLPGRCAEVMTAGAAATESGHFSRAAEKAIEELAAARDVLALGPGLGLEAETVDLVQRLVRRLERPMVIDADGLNALRGRLDLLGERGSPTVLTPHPGEAARLLESTAAQVNADRVAAARSLAEASRAVVLLKGAGTVVADPHGRTLIVPTGGPVLAAGGSGDVLTGVVAALLAAALPAFEAAGLAAWWHGATGDRAAQARVGFGLLASELADALPECAAALSLWRDTDGSGTRLPGPGGDDPDAELDLRFPGP